jgi:hypothetical protein
MKVRISLLESKENQPDPILRDIPENPQDLRDGESFNILHIPTAQGPLKFSMQLSWVDGDGKHDEQRILNR